MNFFSHFEKFSELKFFIFPTYQKIFEIFLFPFFSQNFFFFVKLLENSEVPFISFKKLQLQKKAIFSQRKFRNFFESYFYSNHSSFFSSKKFDSKLFF